MSTRPPHPFSSAKAYARTLAARHSDIGFIRAMVRREWSVEMPRADIEAMRQQALDRIAFKASKWDRAADGIEHRAKQSNLRRRLSV